MTKQLKLNIIIFIITLCHCVLIIKAQILLSPKFFIRHNITEQNKENIFDDENWQHIVIERKKVIQIPKFIEEVILYVICVYAKFTQNNHYVVESKLLMKVILNLESLYREFLYL